MNAPSKIAAKLADHNLDMAALRAEQLAKLNDRVATAKQTRTEQLEAHMARRRAHFANIARLASMVTDTTKCLGMDRIALAMAYELQALELDNIARDLPDMEADNGLSSEFAHVHEDRVDRFKREWGVA